jgi:hypothetical protein
VQIVQGNEYMANKDGYYNKSGTSSFYIGKKTIVFGISQSGMTFSNVEAILNNGGRIFFAEFDGKINSWTSVPLPLYEGLKTEDARLIRTAVTDWSGDHLLTVGENRINKVGYYASEEFLEMFEFPMISGSPRQSLEQPNSIVITESVARALFGENDAMGQVIRLDNQDEVQVTGILQDVPTNSSFQFDCLIPWKLNETRD